MQWQDRIEINPGVLVGKPVIRGTRLAVEFIVELLANNWSEQQIFENYPGVTHEDISACLHYAGRQCATTDLKYDRQKKLYETELLRRITVNPAVFGGKPIIRGRRLAVEHVLGMLSVGDTPETILEGYPWLEPTDIQACLVFARRHVGHERIEPLEFVAETTP